MLVTNISRKEQIQQIFDTMAETLSLVRFSRIATFKHLGLGRSHFWALRMINHHQGPISIKELSQKLNVTSGAVSQLSDCLVEKELIIRCEDPDDRRIVRLELTDKAKEIFKQLRLAHLEHITSLFANFSADDLHSLATLLNKLKIEKHDNSK